MKNLKLFILAISLSLFTTSTISATTTEAKAKDQLRTEIVELLGDYGPIAKESNLTAKVTFMLNQNNEIVVLSVESKNRSIDIYVKNKLNYEEIKTKGIENGKIFILPLTVSKSI